MACRVDSLNIYNPVLDVFLASCFIRVICYLILLFRRVVRDILKHFRAVRVHLLHILFPSFFDDT